MMRIAQATSPSAKMVTNGIVNAQVTDDIENIEA